MNYINKNQFDLASRVNMLWMQHSEWSRMAFTSVIFKNPDEEQVVKRLLRNPVDFAHFLRNFYGDDIASKFGELLTEHLTIATNLVRASRDNNTKESEILNKRLYENADEISYFLSCINPHWIYESWRDMFYMHLDLAKLFAEQMIKGKYQESIDTYDRFESEVMVMSQMMWRGILGQFIV